NQKQCRIFPNKSSCFFLIFNDNRKEPKNQHDYMRDFTGRDQRIGNVRIPDSGNGGSHPTHPGTPDNDDGDDGDDGSAGGTSGGVKDGEEGNAQTPIKTPPILNDEEDDDDCQTSKEDLMNLFPDASATDMQTLADAINDYAADFGIDTKAELQQFLA